MLLGMMPSTAFKVDTNAISTHVLANAVNAGTGTQIHPSISGASVVGVPTNMLKGNTINISGYIAAATTAEEFYAQLKAPLSDITFNGITYKQGKFDQLNVQLLTDNGGLYGENGSCVWQGSMVFRAMYVI